MRPQARAYRLTAFTLAGLLAVLGACGSPPLPNSNNGSPAGALKVMVWGSQPQLQAYQNLVALYQQRNPGQIINLITLTSESDYQKRLSADFTAGAPADIILLNYLNLLDYAARGLLAPVAPYVANNSAIQLNNFYNQTIGAFTYDRQLQCLPQDVASYVVFYNKDLFQKAGVPAPQAGWSRDALLADAQALTHGLDGTGQSDQYGLGLEPTLPLLTTFLWQDNGILENDSMGPSAFALNKPAVLTTTTWLVSLQTQYHVVPDSQAELAASSEQRFLDGTLAMYIGTRAEVPSIRQITGFDWDVAPLPSANGRTTSVLFTNGYCLTAASAKQAAGWRFIQFAASSDGQAVLAQSGALVPALTAVARSSAFLDPAARPAHSQVFLDMLAQAEPMPLLSNWTDIQAITDEELGQAYYGQKDVAAALAAATTRSDEYFKFHSAH